jgi:hypothetical protein
LKPVFRVKLAVALLPVLAFREPQILPPPGQPPQPAPAEHSSYAEYGDPEPAELASFSDDAGTYQRRNVRTKARFDVLVANRYYALTDGIARVLLIPVPELSADLHRLVGYRVDVTGVVRQIRPKQYVRGVDLDLIEDPALPVLPAPAIDLPRVSLTALGMSDISPLEKRAGAPALAHDIAADPARYAGKKLTVVGQFRGRNLFGDLPAASQRDAADWVLKDGDSALWVTGKRPQGKGWSLDPAYRGDASKWLAVTGKAEVANGIVYLRASLVTLTSRPKTEDDSGR